ncbi:MULTISPECIES: curli production assembly/transport protein CsgE [unclassified Caballeronia]|uniref:curli production assembly/transport protein CsgE n=1 Tax=unclassified Caballeronia TaxID=2646786 RepID=UPI002027D3C4|nr:MULTISPECIES: curli production assembly/transport protein CsgE [unclassified Caballeronia]MDR5774018.1 curli production assembly/transport protein CsgE [Caballeronia sp. LZ002]MDR5849453.1 curli production assembly/transport protein CsgE [Caballeronia sp. LZ003]
MRHDGDANRISTKGAWRMPQFWVASMTFVTTAALLGNMVDNAAYAQGAQDADSPSSAHGSASGNEARALVTLPNPPTPSPLTRVRPQAASPALTDSATVSRQSTITGSNTLPAKPDARSPLVDTLGGIVTNDAVTLVGEDFYNFFAQAWTQMPMSERYNVSVHERPSARYGSLIWVEYDQRRVFQAFLPIARANVRPIAESAAASALQTVLQADISRLLFHEADLASDEM